VRPSAFSLGAYRFLGNSRNSENATDSISKKQRAISGLWLRDFNHQLTAVVTNELFDKQHLQSNACKS
jgi:hypothetical protein